MGMINGISDCVCSIPIVRTECDMIVTGGGRGTIVSFDLGMAFSPYRYKDITCSPFSC